MLTTAYATATLAFLRAPYQLKEHGAGPSHRIFPPIWRVLALSRFGLESERARAHFYSRLLPLNPGQSCRRYVEGHTSVFSGGQSCVISPVENRYISTLLVENRVHTPALLVSIWRSSRFRMITRSKGGLTKPVKVLYVLCILVVPRRRCRRWW